MKQAVSTVGVKVIGLRIDIETKSRTDIKYGVYRYTEDPDFEVLKIAYSPIRQYTGGATKLGQVRLLELPPPGFDGDPDGAWHDKKAVDRFKNMLRDTRFQKHAFNANFERVALSKWLGLENGGYLDPENWHCSAVKANVNGVFGTLGDVARAVRSPIVKDAEGKRLIRLFSIPDKKSGQFHTPTGCWCGADHWDDWLAFGRYCQNDVLTEAVVASRFNPMPDHVQTEYEADQRINDRGFRHFKALSEAAVAQVAVERDRLMDELTFMTGLDNPNSTKQFGEWLQAQEYPMVSLDKAHREEALADPLVPEHVAEALELKGAASLSSVQKHKAALDTRCLDGRIRGSLRFYGAHTGREAGRGIQPQNLPRYEASKADRISLIRGTAGHDAPQIAKGTVRASIVPARGHVFVTCDYNAIEARVLGWLTGEPWVNAEFAGQGKIYEATASMMFGVDKAKLIAALKVCDKCGKLSCQACVTRGKGKVSNLALGYAGAAGALVTMGAAEAGIDIGNYAELHAVWVAAGKPGKFHEWERDQHDYPELMRLRDLYRNASPETVRFWKLCGVAFDRASAGKGARFGANGVLAMIRDGQHNRLVLPSQRSIWYRFGKSIPRATPNARGDFPIDRRIFTGKSSGVGHVRTDTHGGKLTENATQAVARDVMFDLIMKIEAQQNQPGRIVLHVHDEVVLEVPEASAEQRLADMLGMMSEAPTWASGLAVKGEGAVMERYRK